MIAGHAALSLMVEDAEVLEGRLDYLTTPGTEDVLTQGGEEVTIFLEKLVNEVCSFAHRLSLLLTDRGAKLNPLLPPSR